VERPDAFERTGAPARCVFSGLKREGAADRVFREKMSPGSERVLVDVNSFKKFLSKAA
jgi:hypothetical protein